MRLLRVQGCFFKTSDDCGTLPDALRELADYIEDDSVPPAVRRETEPTFADFLDVLDRGKRVTGAMSLDEHKDGAHWRRLWPKDGELDPS